jgi:hypothetical protein
MQKVFRIGIFYVKRLIIGWFNFYGYSIIIAKNVKKMVITNRPKNQKKKLRKYGKKNYRGERNCWICFMNKNFNNWKQSKKISLWSFAIHGISS